MSNLSKNIYKRLLCPLFLILVAVSCSTIKYIPIESEIIEKEVVKDTVIYVEVPVERIVEIVPELDTLYLETSVAKSEAYLDTALRVIKGKIENKPVQLEKEIQIVKKEVEVIKEVPIEVEVPMKYIPTFYKFCLCWFVLSVLLVVCWIYIKIN